MSGMKPSPADQLELACAELLAAALIREGQRHTSNPGTLMVALAQALGRAAGMLEGGRDPAPLLAQAVKVATASSEFARMDAALRAAGILAVHDGGHA